MHEAIILRPPIPLNGVRFQAQVEHALNFNSRLVHSSASDADLVLGRFPRPGRGVGTGFDACRERDSPGRTVLKYILAQAVMYTETSLKLLKLFEAFEAEGTPFTSPQTVLPRSEHKQKNECATHPERGCGGPVH